MQKSPHIGPRTGTSPASWGTSEARLWKGYECTKILIDILLRGLKGDSMYSAGVALKRKIAFPLFNTIKVCRRKEESGWHHIFSISIQHNAVRSSYLHTVAQGRRKAAMELYKQFQCLQAGVSHFGQWTSRFPLFNKWRLELYASMYTRMYITHL